MKRVKKMTNKLIIDVSSSQDHPIDFKKVKKAGVKAVILKATQGTDYVNPFFHEDLEGCNKVGLPVMAYHFAEFGDVNAEVEAFTKVAGSRARALDIETSTNVAWATEFIQAIQKQFSLNRDQTMLYGSASSIPQGNPREFLLWVAAYHTTPNNSTVPNTSLWQYSDSGKIDGINNNVDLSKWVGTTQNFNSFFGLK